MTSLDIITLRSEILMNVAFYTLGCKVNQYETDSMMNAFKNKDYKIVNFDDVSDVYVINTCTVTNMSDRKSRQIIRKAVKLNPNALIVVVGCYAQVKPDEILKIPEVGLIIGSSNKSSIVELVGKALNEKGLINTVDDIMKISEFEETPIERSLEHTRAYLKIQDGCRQFCSYCIIPYARGNIRSRQPEEVYEEVVKLSNNGFKEVVLAGIHVASYGKDLKDKDIDLIQLVININSINNIKRIRLSSIEPTYFTEDNIIILSKLNKLCNHFHLSLQSGCDETLKRMNRKYTAAQYKEVVENIRKYIPGASITTDVIVGFPGETEEEFGTTLNFLKDIKLTKLHVFKFSPRTGTKAAVMENQIDESIKNLRSHELISLSEKTSQEFMRQYIGKSLDILVEQQVKDNEKFLEGLTNNYIRVIFEGDLDLKGEIVNIEILSIDDETLIGRLR
jgi:threonylcarbamoyladenosine tRNA methylthiotransferase MtaB